MEYTYPEYFYDFRCEASGCSDTCCAGWRIAIDDLSLRKYRKYPGFFGNRLRNSINWQQKTFEQYGGRCAFLNEENLCDIYAEAGEQMLCKTCTRYPRHYEEYENLREISLSLSCPAAAKMILGTEKKMSFLSSCRKTPEEEYEQFDFFLFTKLQEIRDYLYEVIQNRELSIEFRMALILAAVHDLQTRISRKQLYAVDELLKKYRAVGFIKKAAKKFAVYGTRKEGRRQEMQQLFKRLHRLEELKGGWHDFLSSCERKLYHELPQEEYEAACRDFAAYYKDREYEYEQILMYFVFTYFCGAVYDKDAFSKIKLAVVSVMLLREMAAALWMEGGRQFTFEEQVELVHRYAREVEHSDRNMEAMENMAQDEDAFELEALLAGILGV